MMLRPLFVTGSLGHGGAERHTVTLMNRLAERGHECHAVYVKNDTDQLVRIRRWYDESVRCLHARHFFDRRALADFAAHLLRVRPTVLVAANEYALMYASLAQMQSGLAVPVVATFHTTRLLDLKEHLKMLIARPFFWRAQRTIFVCDMQKRYWLRRGLGSRRNLVIHNGVDTEHFRDRSRLSERRALRESLGFSGIDYLIGIPAVLRPEKNHLQLLDAIASLRQMAIPARLMIIGDGPLRGEIEARIRELKLEQSVRITGFVEDVRPYLAACDVTALCSVSETFSLAALESMAMGKPVVHSNVGGAKEMIFPGHNGYLFRPGDTGELVYRLLTLSGHELARRMGEAGRGVVETSFSESAMVERYENVLGDVCAGQPASPSKERHPETLLQGGISGIQIKQGASSHEKV